MARKTRCLTAGACAIAATIPATALAQQKAAENAVTAADDAFGTAVGLESTGIYSENDARGFSPTKAGNVRVDGIYFDPVASVSFRLRSSQAIRIGYAALDYPFPAPTGIADNQLRTVADDRLAVGLGIHKLQYGSFVQDLDAHLPILGPRLGLVLGLSHGHAVQVDGSISENAALTLKPVVRFSGVELSPFYSAGIVRDSTVRPIVVLAGTPVPALPRVRHYFGSHWARNNSNNLNLGATLKAAMTPRLSLRAGLFRSSLRRITNYSESFTITDDSGFAAHRLVADPEQDIHSLSGEAQLAWRFGSDRWQHRLIAGFRGRDRTTESGGSDPRDFGTVRFGEPDDDLKPAFRFSKVNRGSVRQTAFLLGYLGRIEGSGRISLGLQRADFKAEFTGRDPLSGAIGTSREHEREWLYNASLGVELAREFTLYAGTQRGLEDSGAAPENAANRNEQLPPTRSTQYEAGLRWKHGGVALVISAFQISKPYFSFDAGNRFTDLGTVRHRGIEASLSGHFGKHLSLLAGAMLMKPEVSGEARALRRVGPRPVGTPSVYARIDANYRTAILGGLTPTLSVTYQGRRTASARPLDAAGRKQLMLPRYVPVDIGLRQPVRLGRYPATIRLLMQNAFDDASWKVIASNTLQPEDRRRFTAELLIDF
jgi:iron complex outermembrane receptor protein